MSVALAPARVGMPRDPAALLAEGRAARAAGDTQGAERALRAAIAADDQAAEAMLCLGALLLAAGRAAEAVPVLGRAAAFLVADGEVAHALGLALLAEHGADAALPWLIRAALLLPERPLVVISLAETVPDSALDVVAAGLLAASRRAPGRASLLAGLAACAMRRGARPEADQALEAAALLAPEDLAIAMLWAGRLARSTRQAEAERALRFVLTHRPEDADATMALSVVLMRRHRYAEAAEILRALAERGPDRMGPLCNLATALTALGDSAGAVAHARAAVALAPWHPAPRRALCNALPYAPGVDGPALLEAAKDAARLHPPSLPAPSLPAPSLPAPPVIGARDRTLRVGLVSGTLRAHPVGWLTLAGFEQLDRAAFSLICLSGNPPEDPIGRRFAAIAEDWVDTGALDDVSLARRARALGIDIAIDLGGFGDFGRLPAFAHRLAPVQVKWVGMQNHSTGMAAMDWFVTDRIATPPGYESTYAENLLVMPDGYVCYTPPDAPQVAPPPMLERGHVTFGCFNNLAKINPPVLDGWARILAAVPDARLLLKSHPFNHDDARAAMRSAFYARGIDPARIELRGSSPHRELLRQYADVDLVLDPSPYSGGLTTIEGLWMGVPTLTCPGTSFASRHSATHMVQAGLADWVVPDPNSYQAAAVRHAADPAGLARLRAGLRARLMAGPLLDQHRFGRALGSGLGAAYAATISGRPPRRLHVSL